MPSFSSDYESDDKSFFTTPYQISHRIYITDSGQVKHEPQVLGSGGGEVRRKRKPPPLPPRDVIKLTPPRFQQAAATKVFSPFSFRSPRQRSSAATKSRSLSESETMISESPYHYAKSISAEEGTSSHYPVPPLPPKERSQSSGENYLPPSTSLPPLSSPPPSRQEIPQPKPRSRTICSTISVRHNQSSPQLSTRKVASVKPPVPLPRKNTLTKKDGGSHSANSSPVLSRRMQRSLSSGSVSSDEYMRINVCYKINDYSHGNHGPIYNNFI